MAPISRFWVFVARLMVFVVGLAGYAALVWAMYQHRPHEAIAVAGVIAMWWSWYVSVGVHRRDCDRKNVAGES